VILRVYDHITHLAMIPTPIGPRTDWKHCKNATASWKVIGMFWEVLHSVSNLIFTKQAMRYHSCLLPARVSQVRLALLSLCVVSNAAAIAEEVWWWSERKIGFLPSWIFLRSRSSAI
jgi:hypothetical protein